MGEFLGFGGYQRQPEGYMSWQHLVFVGSLLTIMAVLAIFLGLRNRDRSLAQKNRAIMVAAIAIDAFEIFKIVVMCLRAKDPMGWTTELPLFLCSIQLITLPLAAFSKGRIQEASLDFVCIFGLLGAVLGTIGAGQNYNCYPVLSLDNVVSGVTHCISGFAALYLMIAKGAGLKKENMIITFGILVAFCIMAFTANVILDYNYMFLVRGDGTPYDILYNLVGGNQVIYPMCVVGLFLVYISAFYGICFRVRKKKQTPVNV